MPLCWQKRLLTSRRPPGHRCSRAAGKAKADSRHLMLENDGDDEDDEDDRIREGMEMAMETGLDETVADFEGASAAADAN